MKITVIGTGYVGLVTGTCLAEVGNDVLCLDMDADKIAGLREGRLPIYEPGLDDMVARNVKAGRLHFTTDLEAAAHFGTIQFIAVGTPPGEDGSADTQYVAAAARNIGRYMTDYKVVVDKSTVPVGTADMVRGVIEEELAKRAVSTPFSVVSNPEFLKEGAAIEDFMRPGRIVIGCDNQQAELNMRALYAPFQRHHDRLFVMDIRSAELTKYAANAMLATRISFMNELANLAELVGADIEQVRKGIGSDPRIGYDFLYAGAGYGGSCFPKDVKALIKTASDKAGMQLKVLHAVEEANAQQKHVLGNKVKKRFGDDLRGKHFALWGLAFKANTDDIRESVAITVVQQLVDAGAHVTVFDPEAMANAQTVLGDTVTYAPDPVTALTHADVGLVMTEWAAFQTMDLGRVREVMATPTLIDMRYLWDIATMQSLGFTYFPIGTAL